MKKILLALAGMFAIVFATPSFAAFAIGVSAQGATIGTTAMTTSSVTTATTGSTFVILVNGGPASETGVIISDNKGNTYPTTPNILLGFNVPFGVGAVYVCQGCAGGAGHTFTVTFPSSASGTITAIEITSGGSFATIDQNPSPNNSLSNVTTATSPSLTPTVNGAAVLSFFIAGTSGGTDTTITDATGYNNIFQPIVNASSNGNFIGAVGALIQTTAASTHDVFTIGTTSNGAAATLSFKPSSVAGAALASAATDAITAAGALTTGAAPIAQILLDNSSHSGGSDNLFKGTTANDGTGDTAFVFGGKLKQWAADLNTMTAQIYGVRSVQTPVTGFTIAAAVGITRLLLTPAGTLATGTVTFPPNPGDDQSFELMSSQTITALTLNTSDSSTISGAATTLSANSAVRYRYVSASSKWFREQ